MDKFLFLLAEGMKNLWRHKITAFTSIFSIILSLSAIGVFLIASQNTDKLLEYIRSKYKIEVFFKSEVTLDEATFCVDQINKIKGVKSTTLIDKDQALKIYQSQIGENLMEFLEYNPLPLSCVVNLEQSIIGLLDITTIVNMISNIQGVDVVHHQSQLIHKIESFYQKSIMILTFVISAIVLITVLIITNTIKLTIYSNKNLIYSMNMIGASRSFIRTPFVFEALFQGLIGATFSVILLYFTVYFLNSTIQQFSAFTIHADWLLMVWIFLIAILISLLGSTRAITKFLK